MYIGKAPFVLTRLKRLTQLTIHLVPWCPHDFCTKCAIPNSIHVVGKFLQRRHHVQKMMRWVSQIDSAQIWNHHISYQALGIF
jgi:hypothetical protein